jgi:hypothetical protein
MNSQLLLKKAIIIYDKSVIKRLWNGCYKDFNFS